MSVTRNVQVLKNGLRTEVIWSEPEKSGWGEIIKGLMLQIKEFRVGLKVTGSQWRILNWSTTWSDLPVSKILLAWTADWWIRAEREIRRPIQDSAEESMPKGRTMMAWNWAVPVRKLTERSLESWFEGRIDSPWWLRADEGWRQESKMAQFRDFPGSPVVNNLPANAEEVGSIPGPGRSHMPCCNKASVLQLLKTSPWSLCSSTREAIRPQTGE